MYYFNENIPNCVPTFYLDQQEDEDIRYEKQLRREEQYRKNRQLLDDASAHGFIILAEMNCAYECWECKTRTPSIQRDADDDIGLFVCLKGFCIHQDEKGE